MSTVRFYGWFENGAPNGETAPSAELGEAFREKNVGGGEVFRENPRVRGECSAPNDNKVSFSGSPNFVNTRDEKASVALPLLIVRAR